MLNYVALSGTLEQDPEMQYGGDYHDQPQASFDLIFQTGHDRTGRIKVICCNRLAALVGRYLRQGVRVAVAGVLDQQQGETAEEQEKNGFRLIARTLELIKTDRRGNTRFTLLESRLPGQRVSGDMPQDDLSKGSD
jgi:single-stranded DNA-binding protein